MNKYILRAAVSVIIAPASIVFCDSNHREKSLEDNILQVAGRLKSGIDANNLLCRPNKDGVEICTLKRASYHKSGFPHFRVARARIHAPLEEVSSLWQSQGARKNWDSNYCDDSQVVKEYNSETSLAYIRGRPGYVIPARDYAFHICRVPGGIVGLNDFMSVAFINVDAANAVPTCGTAWAVRGNMNSILLLRPVNAEITDVTYIVECSVNGWIFPFVAEYFADTIVKTLTNMKKELEADENSEEATASIEEAARLRFQRHLAQKEENKATTIVNDITSNPEDLQETLAILQRRLKEIQASKRTDGIDLSRLEDRVKKDIAHITHRLQQHRNSKSNYESSSWK